MQPQVIRDAIHKAYGSEDAVWVGPLIDGLAWLLADDVLRELQIPAHDWGSKRRWFKALLSDATSLRQPEGPATHFRAAQVSVQRAAWAKPKQEPPRIYLTKNVVDNEPGTLINSPKLVLDPETGIVTVEPLPIIREDKRYGLHRLLKGDRIHIQYTNHRRQYFAFDFDLRAKAEGPSLVTPDRRSTDILW